jgi:serine/threonine-protein kinase
MKPAQEVGRYTIFGEIASGGMATVHIGKVAGAAGFVRTVAVKQLHPQLAADPSFVAMFLDEAWLAARIHHPNVVQTLDVVSEEGQLFLVMDYVQGETLSRLWRALREKGELAPPAITASVLAGVLHGLHAAHEAKDDAGKPLEIVHRDVSPQNVMVGVDGVARLLDFGVAKAAVRLQTTQEGQIKGKLAYMAPELLEHGDVSRLVDVYAVGVMLWEGLTGKRLFEAATEGQLLHRILFSPVDPPSAAAPARASVSSELDAIALRALERDPKRRFQSAREMALAIERATEIARASQVSEWVERVAKPMLDERAQRIALLRDEARSAAPPSSAAPRRSESSSAVRALASAPSSSSARDGAKHDKSSLTPASRSRPGIGDVTPTPGTPSGTGAKRTKRRVLAIDDSEIILSKIKHALEAEGIEVVTTTQTVGNARHLVDCDLVIIDFHMPGLDGGEVISSLRAATAASSHPAVFYLYTQDPAIAKEYARLGFDGCLTEKGDEKELVRQVRSAFRMIQMRALKKG